MNAILGPLFWDKVNLFGAGGCWLWNGSINATTGYGQVKIGGRVMGAHRASYEWLVGPVRSGLHLDHLCRVTRCVNPDHLEPVTPRENIARGRGPSAHALRTGQCINGHEFTAENTYTRKNGTRACKECRRARNRKYWAAR